MNLGEPATAGLSERSRHPGFQSRLEGGTVTCRTDTPRPPPHDRTPACRSELGALLGEEEHAVPIGDRDKHVYLGELLNPPHFGDIDSQGPLRGARYHPCGTTALPVTKRDPLTGADAQYPCVLSRILA